MSVSAAYSATLASTMLYGIQSLYLYILRTTGEPPELPNKIEPKDLRVVNCSLAMKYISMFVEDLNR